MGSAVALRRDYSPPRLRQLARHCKDSKQSRRLLSLAAVLDGMSRTDAARVGGMDRQTLRDWVHRFNDHGPDGLKNITPVVANPGYRQTTRSSSHRSSGPVPIWPPTVSCAGGGWT